MMKRYISSDRKTTQKFGHYLLRDEYITKCVENDWDTELHEPYSVFKLPEGREAFGLETPDTGFHQPLYSNVEIKDIVDISNISDQFVGSNHDISNPPHSQRS